MTVFALRLQISANAKPTNNGLLNVDSANSSSFPREPASSFICF